MNYPMLPEKQNFFLSELKEELQDTIQKVQKYRTETEMRVSVLNDASHPTPASKYWQCVREQNMMYEQLRISSYEYRRRQAKILGMKDKMKKSKDKYEKMELQVDIEEMEWSLENIKYSSVDKPIFLHCVTKKGKGYEPAEKSDDKFHGVNKFDIISGAPIKKSSVKTYSKIYVFRSKTDNE